MPLLQTDLSFETRMWVVVDGEVSVGSEMVREEMMRFVSTTKTAVG